LEEVKSVLEKAKIQLLSAQISMIPQSYNKVDGAHASSLLRLLEDLEEHDDVQDVFSNFDMDEADLNASE